MEKTLNKYRHTLQTGKINPVVRWDGRTSKTIFDPADPETPLEHAGLGAWNLADGPFELQTGEKEYVLIPICGEFEVSVGENVFAGSRPGGPFATEPELSNASAVYLGRNQKGTISGEGEMVWLSGPAFGDKPAAFVKPGQIKQQRWGASVWHREVLTLITPGDLSTNLTVGETYTPPGLWSGTPLHVHDKDDPAGGQSDHEEIYYHLARITGGKWEQYGVQLLFDDQGLDKAYMVHNRDAVAIPGGAHPVVAGPGSDMLFIWSVVSHKSNPLTRYDIPEFSYLASIQTILNELEAKRGQANISRGVLADLADRHQLKGDQREILRQHLIERGFKIQ